MNKLSGQITAKVLLFLGIVLTVIWVLFSVFAFPCVKAERSKHIENVFAMLQQTEMDELLEEIEEEELYLEEENINVLICDEDFELVYSSNGNKDEENVRNKIERQSQHYKLNAVPEYSKNAAGERVAIRGKFRVGDEMYYVRISSTLTIVHSNILYAQVVLLGCFVLVFFACLIFMSLSVRKCTDPLDEIRQVMGELESGKLEARCNLTSGCGQTSDLLESVNAVAERMYADRAAINNYKYLLSNQEMDLAELDVMQKKLVSNVTHQLKTPLAIISSQLDLEFVEKDPEKKKYYMNSIMEEIDKMSEQISNILNASKSKQSPLKVKVSRADLSELLEEMALKYDSWLTSKGIVFEADIEKGLMAQIDSYQIEQAVNNYMMNACKHTKKGKKVVLRLYHEEEHCMIEVRNEGNGISEADLDNIWKDYYQRNAEKGSEKMEVGLGLYIVKDIMRQHGGSCGVKNEPDGVTFWLKIQNVT